VNQEVSQEPLLNLGRRNSYAAIGDPLLPFTSSRLELLVGQSIIAEPLQLSREESMIASFLGAADAIASGESVFLEQNEELINDPTLLAVGQKDVGASFENLTDSTVIYCSSSFLAAINCEIPLECFATVTNAVEEQPHQDWMSTFEESRGPDDWTAKSRVPNYTFTSRRTSGIYGDGGLIRKQDITAYAIVGSGVDAKFKIQSQGPVDVSSTFVFPYEGQQRQRLGSVHRHHIGKTELTLLMALLGGELESMWLVASYSAL